MCRQIRRHGYRKPAVRRKSYTNYERMDGKFPGDKVQVDIKYVPQKVLEISNVWGSLLPDYSN